MADKTVEPSIGIGDVALTSDVTFLPEAQLYLIVEEALRTEGVYTPKLARLARQLALSCVEDQAQELAKDGRPVTDEDRGKAFWEILKEAISCLKPPGDPPKLLTREWQCYVILHEEYVLGTPNTQICWRVHLSRRQMLRRRKTAIERVTRLLLQWG
jgi:hypothetical protein